jgi:hypothetical protein
MSPAQTALRTACAITAALLVGACDREDIHAYRAPKAPPPVRAKGAAPVSQKVAWDVPEGWRTVESNQQVRIATFRAGPGDGVEVSVTAFPGDVGGLLANVNRWRTQVGLEPAQESDLPTIVKTVRGQSGDVSLLDLEGKNGQHVLAAIAKPGDGQSWFIKATGTPETVAPLRESFEKFASSVRLGSEKPAPSAMTAPGAPPVAPSAASGEVAERLGAWKPPATWAKDAIASGVVAAAFNIKNPQGDVRVTATSLAGDGGGVLMNVNRWREQLSLPAVATLSEQPTTTPGNGATEVDLVDANSGRRMIAVIVTADDQTWFFKLTGPPTLVEVEKSAFEQFVKDVGLGGR